MHYGTTHGRTWSIGVLIPHRTRSPGCITACIGACHLFSERLRSQRRHSNRQGHLMSSEPQRGANRGASRGAAAQPRPAPGKARARAGIASSASGEYSPDRCWRDEATGGWVVGPARPGPRPPPRALRRGDGSGAPTTRCVMVDHPPEICRNVVDQAGIHSQIRPPSASLINLLTWIIPCAALPCID